MNRLKDKVAIVVGGGQQEGATIGNGRATAITFAREGAKVLVVDINAASAEETGFMIKKKGGTASSLGADVSKADDCTRFVQAALDQFGRIDILHNNVGVMGGDNHLHLLDEASWDRVQEINVKGMFLSCRATLPVMYEQGSGVIINISSTAAIWSGDPHIAYNTSKAAVNGLTNAMVRDCARHGVRVNAIMPGSMHTPLGTEGIIREKGGDIDSHIAQRDAGVPLGNRQGTAWDVANAALFLASDEARHITGAIIPVDGGESSRG